MWYNVVMDADNDLPDCEWVERLIALRLDAEELAASLVELEEDMRHGQNVARVQIVDRED